MLFLGFWPLCPPVYPPWVVPRTFAASAPLFRHLYFLIALIAVAMSLMSLACGTLQFLYCLWQSIDCSHVKSDQSKNSLSLKENWWWSSKHCTDQCYLDSSILDGCLCSHFVNCQKQIQNRFRMDEVDSVNIFMNLRPSMTRTWKFPL